MIFCFIMYSFKMTIGAMVKWWMDKWCNGKIKISISRFGSHKYEIFSFVVAEGGGDSGSGRRKWREAEGAADRDGGSGQL